jgi:hypothetical protein
MELSTIDLGDLLNARLIVATPSRLLTGAGQIGPPGTTISPAQLAA